MGFDLQAHQELRRLSYQVNCLVRDFCCRAKRCFGISDAGNPNLVLNQQGDWVNIEGGGFLPNGIEYVESSRDFQASDAGKLLVIDAPGVILSMPQVFPFKNDDLLAVAPYDDNSGFKNQYGGSPPCMMLSTGKGEVVLLNAREEDDGYLRPISTEIMPDNGVYKTALKYLYDQSQNAIPLSGTISGGPVTGDIALTNSSNYGITSQDGSLYFKIFQDDNYNEISGRMIGVVDYTSTLPDLGYTQKIYVDTKLSRKIFNINTPTTADNTSNVDYVYNVSGGAILTLPTAVGNTNEYKIKNVDTISCDIVSNGIETIDGVNTKTLTNQYDSYIIISDGTNWLIY